MRRTRCAHDRSPHGERLREALSSQRSRGLMYHYGLTWQGCSILRDAGDSYRGMQAGTERCCEGVPRVVQPWSQEQILPPAHFDQFSAMTAERQMQAGLQASRRCHMLHEQRPSEQRIAPRRALKGMLSRLSAYGSHEMPHT